MVVESRYRSPGATTYSASPSLTEKVLVHGDQVRARRVLLLHAGGSMSASEAARAPVRRRRLGAVQLDHQVVDLARDHGREQVLHRVHLRVA